MDKLDLLRKIKALAERGQGGEKVNAEKMLAQLMKKHAITEADFEVEQARMVWFKTFGHRSAMLLYQIVCSVSRNWRPDAYSKSKMVGLFKKTKHQVPNVVGFYLKPAQAVEVEYLFDFYWNLYQQEEDCLFQAFIHKHDLFGDRPPQEDSPSISPQELEKLRQTIHALNNASPYRQISTETGGRTWNGQ